VDEFLTVREVADLLKLKSQTVRNWIDGGKLPAIHIGRRVRINEPTSTGSWRRATAESDATRRGRGSGTARSHRPRFRKARCPN
jgi:excisionase family DNA binding protein